MLPILKSDPDGYHHQSSSNEAPSTSSSSALAQHLAMPIGGLQQQPILIQTSQLPPGVTPMPVNVVSRIRFLDISIGFRQWVDNPDRRLRCPSFNIHLNSALGLNYRDHQFDIRHLSPHLANSNPVGQINKFELRLPLFNNNRARFDWHHRQFAKLLVIRLPHSIRFLHKPKNYWTEKDWTNWSDWQVLLCFSKVLCICRLIRLKHWKRT